MAAVGARHVFHHPPTDAFLMSYFPHGGSSNSSTAASSFSSAFGAAPAPPVDTMGAEFDMTSDYFFGDGGAALGLFPPPEAPAAPAVPDDASGGASATQTRSLPAVAAAERPSTERIAFRTRSEIEILDDGYKWRKYGKKSVKNSPNPRNYYRCSTEGCNVKKRVERDKDDPSYVVTTYEGVHNHLSPSTVYYASQDAASGRFFVAGTHLAGPSM